MQSHIEQILLTVNIWAGTICPLTSDHCSHQCCLRPRSAHTVAQNAQRDSVLPFLSVRLSVLDVVLYLHDEGSYRQRSTSTRYIVTLF